MRCHQYAHASGLLAGESGLPLELLVSAETRDGRSTPTRNQNCCGSGFDVQQLLLNTGGRVV